MKKVKYNGDLEVIMPLFGITIKPGDVVEVDDDFNNSLFTPVVEETQKKGDK